MDNCVFVVVAAAAAAVVKFGNLMLGMV